MVTLVVALICIAVLSFLAGIVAAVFDNEELNDICIKITVASFCGAGAIVIIGIFILQWKGLIPW